MVDTLDLAIFWAVVIARFLIPLTIPKYPLPGVIACLILDGIDQTIFQIFTDLPLEGYQSYDKALDIYYLTITYLSTLRNWSNHFAFRISRFLFYYRLVGVALFELLESRTLLLIFPNTFEYFFIFYEIIRLKWNQDVLTNKKLIQATALIWIFIKLPQEYWIHIAKLDTTDWIRANPSNALILVGYTLFLLFLAWMLVRDLPPMKPGFSFAANPVPAFLSGNKTNEGFQFESIERLREQFINKYLSEKVINRALFEKIILISLLSVIFAQILPGVRSTNLQLAIGMSLLIIINTVVSHWLVKRGNHWKSIIREFIVMSAVNLGLVLLLNYLLPRYDGSINLTITLFFILLLTLIITLYDRYHRKYLWTQIENGYTATEEIK
ncbi:MAG: hypothetical protein ACPK85_08810 [Methanosarcina sp.]